MNAMTKTMLAGTMVLAMVSAKSATAGETLEGTWSGHV